MTALVAGVALGLAGSGHCAGMCGPLVVTITRRLARPSAGAPLACAAIYHSGRLLSYVVLAIPAALAGGAAAAGGLGRILAIGAGVTLLAAAFASRPQFRAGSAGFRPPSCSARISRAASAACAAAAGWGRAHPVAGPFVTGAANGFLPCGLVYTAALTAAALGSPRDAVLLMGGFGLGTVPVLALLSVGMARVPAALRPTLQQLTPVVLILMAVLLLARGLSGLHHHH